MSLIAEPQDYTTFVRKWHAEGLERDGLSVEAARKWGFIDETRTSLLWYLLGQIEPDEVLVRVTESFAADALDGLGDGGPAFVARIEEETEEAIRFTDIAPAYGMAKHAYHIQKLGSEETHYDPVGWVDERLEAHRAAFDNRATIDSERIPKSEIENVIRKRA